MSKAAKKIQAARDTRDPPAPRARKAGRRATSSATVTPVAFGLTVADAPPGAPAPDAALLEAAGKYARLEERIIAALRTAKAPQDDVAAEALAAPIQEEQEAVLMEIVSARARTLDGLRAKAETLVLMGHPPTPDLRHSVDDKLTSSLLRDLQASSVEGVDNALSPDADLIAACAEFRASETAYCAAYDADPALPEEEAIKEGEAIAAGWDGMLDRMEALRARTNEGLAARAAALAQHSGMKPAAGSYAFAFDPQDGTVTGRLLHMLLRDATALVEGLPAANPDADLLALRPEFDRLYAFVVAFNGGMVEVDAPQECADFDALCRRIATMPPAVTGEGRAFQAAATMHALSYRRSETDGATDAPWLMLKGLAGDAYRSTEKVVATGAGNQAATPLSLRSAAPTAAPSISVAALAGEFCAALEAVDTLADGTTASKLAYDRAEALGEAITMLPARTLADAAAQIGQAMARLESLPENGADKQADEDERAIGRVLASVLPVVLAAAGTDPAKLVTSYCLTRWEREFGPLEHAVGKAAV